jgi:hypothetical protein
MHLTLESLVGTTLHAARTRDLERRAELTRIMPTPPRRRIRRYVGRSMAHLGARIAADPTLESTQS